MEMKMFLRANWDRVLAVILVIAGVVMLIVGWFGVSGTGLVAEQNPYLISAGLGGIAVIAIGCTMWMSADLQDEWRRLDGLEERLDRLVSASDRPSPEAVAVPKRSRTSAKVSRGTNGRDTDDPAEPARVKEVARG